MTESGPEKPWTSRPPPNGARPWSMALALAVSWIGLVACGIEAEPSAAPLVDPDEHPFARLPEAQLVAVGAVGGEGARYRLAGFPRLIRVSDTTFVSAVWDPASDAPGVAHLGVEGSLLSWVASPEQLQAWPGGRYRNLGMTGDSVWFLIREGARREIHVHTLDGRARGSRSAPAAMMEAAAAGATAVTAGLVAGGGSFVDTAPLVPPFPRNAFPSPLPVVLMEPGEGQPPDTILKGTDSRAGILGAAFEPFGHPPLHHISRTGRGMMVAWWDPEDPGDLVIEVTSFPDRSTRTLNLSLPRQRIPESDLARITEAGVAVLDRVVDIQERMRMGPEPFDRGPESFREIVRIPRSMPPARAVRLGDDGTLWLLRDEPAPLHLLEDTRGPGASTWVMLDPDGVPRHRLRIPERSMLKAATREEIWTWDLDGGGLTRWSVRVESGGEGEGARVGSP
jgi:hypothetical protein